ncbi:hypothetical protein CR492_13235 [Methylocella silvestris]|uniref:HNH endonuclease n=2 Tax=Methylocella silvestris TaxID=199596 RepID=A0A2J7TFD8_METSI|nr:hypothetical protein CR492_13235 [Methylocella silvestris]
MIRDVLKAREVLTHCSLCGRAFARFPSDEEHIFPRWLQHHHELWNRKLNIPNFLGKRYKTVKITICQRCNGTTFGALETRLAPLLTNGDPFTSIVTVCDAELAVWLGKIFWLLIRKSHSVIDYRTRGLPKPGRIIPDELFPGTLYLGMMQRAFATGKGFESCFNNDLLIPELFCGAPFSLYRFRIDTRDNRFEAFDFMDNPATLGVAFRSDNLGIICIFDGGLHRRFRQHWYEFLAGHALHPLQFAEVAARIIYDQTVLHEDATRVTYYWNKALNAIVSQMHTPRYFNPYLEVHHDPKRQADLIARFTFNDPSWILRPDGSMVTCLHDLNGDFLRFAVTDEELAAARADPNQIVFGPMNSDWRVSEHGPSSSGSA